MIEKNLYHRMGKAGEVNKKFHESNDFYFFLNIDILNGCESICDGCFVPKNVNTKDLDSDLLQVSHIVNQINASPYHLEEIVLGPTDFFSATNTLDIITHKNFMSLFLNKQTKFVIVSTLEAKDEKIIEYLSALSSMLPHLDIDLLIAIDIEKFIRDKDYLNNIKRKWKLIEGSNLLFDPSFQVNILETQTLKTHPSVLNDISEYIKNEFDTILEFNPSCLRTNNKKLIHENLSAWSKIIKTTLSERQSNLLVSVMNPGHRSENNYVLNFKQGSFFICPFIFENVFNYKDNFLIEKKAGLYNLDDLLVSRENFYVKQMSYAGVTKDCNNCDNLISCCNKNVLSFMNTFEIKDCLFGDGMFDASLSR